jgi:hypothetical protein
VAGDPADHHVGLVEDRRRGREAGGGELFADDAELRQAEPGAAVLARGGGAEQSEVGGLAPALGGEALGHVEARGAGGDVTPGELMDGAPQQALLGGEAEVGGGR